MCYTYKLIAVNERTTHCRLLKSIFPSILSSVMQYQVLLWGLWGVSYSNKNSSQTRVEDGCCYSLEVSHLLEIDLELTGLTPNHIKPGFSTFLLFYNLD